MSSVVKRAVALAWPLAAIAWWGATAWLARQPAPWALRLTNPAFAAGLVLTYAAAAVLIVHAARDRRATLFRHRRGDDVAAASALLLLEASAAAGPDRLSPDPERARRRRRDRDVAFVADHELLYRRPPHVRWTGRPRSNMEELLQSPHPLAVRADFFHRPPRLPQPGRPDPAPTSR